MYGAGARAPGQQQRLSGKLVVRAELVAAEGREAGNELVILVRDLEGAPLATRLESAGLRLEPLE
ncbi:MAG: hypothetical protein MI919_24215, partial [Holophagales bacterium]|nr:hypothetical protein [Holophagales bacterium]